MQDPSLATKEFEERYRADALEIPGNIFIGIRTYDANGKLIRTDCSVGGMQAYFEGLRLQGHDPEGLMALNAIAKSLSSGKKTASSDDGD